jgi:hypothetical protein
VRGELCEPRVVTQLRQVVVVEPPRVPPLPVGDGAFEGTQRRLGVTVDREQAGAPERHIGRDAAGVRV